MFAFLAIVRKSKAVINFSCLGVRMLVCLMKWVYHAPSPHFSMDVFRSAELELELAGSNDREVLLLVVRPYERRPVEVVPSLELLL